VSKKYTVGIFGSNTGDMNTTLPQATALGQILGQFADSIVLITGAFAGIPYQVAKSAASAGVEVWGFSEASTEAKQKELFPGNELTIYRRILYLPADFEFIDYDRACKKYRNVLAIANCDAGIIIAGRWGTLNEFTNLLDMQKTVGVLTGTGGVADEISNLSHKISKAGQGEVVFESEPKMLVERILSAVASSSSKSH
jgi:predicted Rossmann-fold nucleotide-binding protein